MAWTQASGKILEARALMSAPLPTDHWTPPLPQGLFWNFPGQQSSSELWLGPGPRIPHAFNLPFSTHLGRCHLALSEKPGFCVYSGREGLQGSEDTSQRAS